MVGSTTIPLPTLGPSLAVQAITALGYSFSCIKAVHVAYGGAIISLGGLGTLIQASECLWTDKAYLVIFYRRVFYDAPTLPILGYGLTPVNRREVDTGGMMFSIGRKGTTPDGSQISGLIVGHATITISVPFFKTYEEAVTTDPMNLDRRWMCKDGPTGCVSQTGFVSSI